MKIQLDILEKCWKIIPKLKKGSFVTLGIPVVDKAFGDLLRLLCRVGDIIDKGVILFQLSCEFDILNSCYAMGDIYRTFAT